MIDRPRRMWIGGLFAAAALAAGDAAHAGFAWEQDWLASAPMTFGWPRSQPDVKVAFGADGGVLVEGQSPMYARFDGAGALRWSVDTGLYSTLAMTGTADGGAYVLASGGPDAQLIRIDPSGATVWSRSAPALRFAEVGSARVAAAGVDFLTVMDAASGNVVWQRRITQDVVYADDWVSLAADATGNLYVTTGSATGLRTIKFDASGNEQWNVGSTAAGEGGIVGVGIAMLFERFGDVLRARRVGDGSVAWTLDIFASDFVLASDDGEQEPIVVGTAEARRFAADTGQPRWTATLPNISYPASVIGGKLVLSSNGQLVAVDASSGATGWTIARPASDAYGNGLTFDEMGGLQGGAFFVVAHPNGPYQRAPLFLQRFRLDNGAAVATAPTPTVPQRAVAASIAPAPGYAITAAATQHASTVDIELRKLDATTGSVIWQMSDPVTEFGADGPLYPTWLALAEHAGKVATTSSLQQQGCIRSPSGARVSLHDAADGTRLWSTLLTDSDRRCTTVYEPQLDDDSNVFVSMDEGFSCDNGQTCHEAAIYKLASGDGHVVWRDAHEADYGPRGLVLAGGSVVTTVPFRGGATFEGLSPASGGITWSSALYPGYGIDRYVFKVDEAHVVVVGEDDGGTSWAKLDAATGAVLWDRSVAHAQCANLCFENSPTVLPGGDLLIHGKLGSRALLRRFHNDGSGIVDEWLVGADAPSQQAWINRAEIDADGRLDLQLARRPGKQTPPSLHSFARFDMASGALSDEQFIAAYSQDPYEQLTYPDLLRQIDAERFLVQTYATRPPQTGTTGVALLDLTATAHGDLAIETQLDRASAAVGDSVGFHLRATYTGDASLQGVTVFAHMPWPSGVTAPTCATTAAGNCVVDVDSGDVRATFDVSPGGSIEISGSVLALGYPARPLLSAFVHGPTALAEPDLRNNFAAAETSLFADGFDPD
ncbi:MAG TPA: PQQ-binding-like beta-propeller repeat protein [Dokdonella sp.]|nr:PQQ-binding-like beta-propeller repeat protein [Dokdonella sp.]